VSPARGKLILIVDDDSFIRRQVHDALVDSGDGLRVAEASDGQTALAALTTERPDLVLLDLYMPNKSGLEALAEMRARVPDLKIVVMSSLDSDGIKRQVLAAGATDFLAKPFHPLELQDAVRRYLE